KRKKEKLNKKQEQVQKKKIERQLMKGIYANSSDSDDSQQDSSLSQQYLNSSSPYSQSQQHSSPLQNTKTTKLSSTFSTSNPLKHKQTGITKQKLVQQSLFVHTTGAGTPIYTAPECKTSGIYDEKCDIFSLGVILFELFAPPPITEQERRINLINLRSRIFPKQFGQRHPRVQRILIQLLSQNPEERPSAVELLNSNLLPPALADLSLRRAIHIVSDPRQTFRKEMLRKLFEHPSSIASRTAALLVSNKKSDKKQINQSKEMGIIVQSYGFTLNLQHKNKQFEALPSHSQYNKESPSPPGQHYSPIQKHYSPPNEHQSPPPISSILLQNSPASIRSITSNSLTLNKQNNQLHQQQLQQSPLFQTDNIIEVVHTAQGVGMQSSVSSGLCCPSKQTSAYNILRKVAQFICELHGAQDIPVPLFIPPTRLPQSNTFYDTLFTNSFIPSSSNTQSNTQQTTTSTITSQLFPYNYELLCPSGALLSLRSDLTSGFAFDVPLMLQSNGGKIRRYSIGEVWIERKEDIERLNDAYYEERESEIQIDDDDQDEQQEYMNETKNENKDEEGSGECLCEITL
ncbi:MAG: hypothetical protein EZS28_037315, partial [Streblomastix strix]